MINKTDPTTNENLIWILIINKEVRMKEIQKKFFLFNVCKCENINENTNKTPIIWSNWGLGELIKKNIQKEDKIPKIGNNKEISFFLFIDRKIGINDKIDKYCIKFPSSCDFNAKPSIIKISPPLMSRSSICKISVVKIPLFKISIDPFKWYINESECVIGEIEIKKNPINNKIINNKSILFVNMLNFFKKFIFFNFDK